MVQKEAETVQGSENTGEGASAENLAGVSADKAGKGVSAGNTEEGAPGFNVGEEKKSKVSECEILSSQENSEVASTATSAEVCEELSQTTTQEGMQQGMDVDEIAQIEGSLFWDDESIFKVSNIKRKPKDSKGVKLKKKRVEERVNQIFYLILRVIERHPTLLFLMVR